MSGFWTRDKIAELMYYWADGGSASWIGRKLGCSKNAVIGKVARLKLAKRPSPLQRSKAPPIRIHLPRGNKVDRMQSAPCSNGSVQKCAWPIGEPGQKDFRFCGKPAVPGRRPYCEACCAKAYVSQTSDEVVL